MARVLSLVTMLYITSILADQTVYTSFLFNKPVQEFLNCNLFCRLKSEIFSCIYPPFQAFCIPLFKTLTGFLSLLNTESMVTLKQCFVTFPVGQILHFKRSAKIKVTVSSYNPRTTRTTFHFTFQLCSQCTFLDDNHKFQRCSFLHLI